MRPRVHSAAQRFRHFSFHPGTPCCAVHTTRAHASTHASVPLIPHTVTHVCGISLFPSPPSFAMRRSLAHTRSHANCVSFSSTTPRRYSLGGFREPSIARATTAAAVAAPTGAAMSASCTMLGKRERRSADFRSNGDETARRFPRLASRASERASAEVLRARDWFERKLERATVRAAERETVRRGEHLTGALDSVAPVMLQLECLEGAKGCR